MIIIAIAWLIFAIAFISTLYVEARQTSWELLEALVAANILGHVVAYPISKTISDSGYFFSGPLEFQVVTVASLATVVSACMAGGAVWVFRRMKLLGENRRSVRIGYMVLGLLLFPSMILFPYNLFVGWMVWSPLMALNKKANLAAALRRDQEQAAVPIQLPGTPQHRYTVPWTKKSGQRVVKG